MKEELIHTSLGDISIAIEDNGSEIPIIFLHGVFLDKNLWLKFDSELTGKTHIYIDMPAHGKSSNVNHDWNLDDCVNVLIDILNNLEVENCIAIGHSWGSMTILRAATQFQSRFFALGLFNMPFKQVKGFRKMGFMLQKMLVVFPRFYGSQAAKSLYSRGFLENHPELRTSMQERLAKRPPKEIARVIDAVLINPTDATNLLAKLKIPTLAVVGEEDYVGRPPEIETKIVRGGHISPHEAVEETKQAIIQIVRIGE